MKLKVAGLNFSEEEKQRLLRKYFKKYFNEKLDLSKTFDEQQ